VTIRFVCAPYQYTCSIAPTTLSFNAENTPAATLNKQFKQTVSVTSSDLHYKDDNAWFTTVPLKPYLINSVKEKVVFLDLNVKFFNNSY